MTALQAEIQAAAPAAAAALADAIAADGYACLPAVLDADDCRELAAGFSDDERYRATIEMQRYRFGRGTYRYFDYPLPPAVAALRERWYPALAALANRWCTQLREPPRFPAAHADYLACCHAAGQRRPTPLLLRYGPGDHNRLHQDLYGEEVFPLQLIVMLSRPGVDFSGGELVLVEQRPRQQSTPVVVGVEQGSAVVIPVRTRPGAGARGFHRIVVRHGVSRVHDGERLTLGIIFHDAA